MKRPRTDPPRWFVPALFGGFILAGAIIALMFSFGWRALHREQVTIGTAAYAFPAADLSSLSTEPHLFVRVRPRGRPFELVYDSRTAGQRDGRGFPRLFSINDGPSPDLAYSRVGHTPVICRAASAPNAGCGTWIRHAGAEWSILFPTARAGQAHAFAVQAQRDLDRYMER